MASGSNKRKRGVVNGIIRDHEWKGPHQDMFKSSNDGINEQACVACRRRKVRCDAKKPSCAYCISKDQGMCLWRSISTRPVLAVVSQYSFLFAFACSCSAEGFYDARFERLIVSLKTVHFDSYLRMGFHLLVHSPCQVCRNPRG